MLQSINISSKLHLFLFSNTSFLIISTASYPFIALLHTFSISIFPKYFNIISIAWILKPTSSTIRIFFLSFLVFYINKSYNLSLISGIILMFNIVEFLASGKQNYSDYISDIRLSSYIVLLNTKFYV
jgi:hypothetical protein